ncbi:MAG TPA: hypothetical protein VKK31_05625 [Thermoanaerobaculia bacterium]|nr:hypothetical protein [Thermoanaerobaculia bacterium]
MAKESFLDFHSFWAEVLADSSRADEVVDRLSDFYYYQEDSEAEALESNEELELLEEELELIVRRSRGRLLLIADILGASSFVREFEEEWKKYKDKPTALELTKWTSVAYCPPFEYVSEALRAVASIMQGSDAQKYQHEQELSRLERVLAGTAKLLHDRRILPSSEAEVRREVYSILIHFYPDTVREVGVIQGLKTYKVDIGIRSLKAAIEYKFVDSEEEARKFIGGIYEDIHGYTGSADWETFFAVIYMTRPFLADAQVEAERRGTSVPENWRFVLVTGEGGRTRRKSEVEEVNQPADKSANRGAKVEAENG